MMTAVGAREGEGMPARIQAMSWVLEVVIKVQSPGDGGDSVRLSRGSWSRGTGRGGLQGG